MSWHFLMIFNVSIIFLFYKFFTTSKLDILYIIICTMYISYGPDHLLQLRITSCNLSPFTLGCRIVWFHLMLSSYQCSLVLQSKLAKMALCETLQYSLLIPGYDRYADTYWYRPIYQYRLINRYRPIKETVISALYRYRPIRYPISVGLPIEQI